MVKLAFSFFQNPDQLWARVLFGKYFKETPSGSVPCNLRSQSSVWKGMVREWDVMMLGARSAIRNGRDTMFWTSRWVDSGIRLLDFAVDTNIELNLGDSVADFLNLDGQWDIEKLTSSLPSDVVDSVVGMSPPRETMGEDGLVWGREDNGRFSIKSAYSLVRNEPAGTDSGRWRRIWKWIRPNRIRFFLWLAVQDRILTNSNRVRRHLSSDASCSFCHASEETTIHILRDCTFARESWENLGEFDNSGSHWQGDLDSWIRQGLLLANGLLFGVHCWMLWKLRNERIFTGANPSSLNAALRSASWTRQVSEAMDRTQVSLGIGVERRTVNVQWDPGQEGWTNIGACSITRAEMRGAIEGLHQSWEAGHRNVVLRMDSRSAIALLTNGDRSTNQHAMETLQFQELVGRDWNVLIEHTYREGNHAADFLAGIGYGYPLGSHSVDLSDSRLGYFLRLDLFGVGQPRSVLIND
ncbi:Putative ribonuclease H protein At1g65750 [Linum perenne]